VVDGAARVADVVVVRAHGHVLPAQRRVAPGEHRHHVARRERHRLDLRREGEGDGLPGGAEPDALERGAEQRLGARGREDDGGRRLGAGGAGRRVVDELRRAGEEAHERVEPDEHERGRLRRRRLAAQVAQRAGRERHAVDDDLAGRRVAAEHGRVAERAAEHHRRVLERGRPDPRGHPVGAERHGRAADDEPRRRVDRAHLVRERLEVRAPLAGGLQPEAARLGRQVVGALDVAERPRVAPHHGVVGERVEARHQVGRGDRRAGGAGRVLERQRRGGRGGAGVGPGVGRAARGGDGRRAARAGRGVLGDRRGGRLGVGDGGQHDGGREQGREAQANGGRG
jgi:hypothetical protein